jgi:lipoate-protein ligase A
MTRSQPPVDLGNCRLLVDPPAAGAWNMAVDEALLDWSAEHGARVLRFYRWSEPTLSLGYFQSYAERMRHPPSCQATVVRRSSGGGAILHDHELTYSLSMPGDHALADDSTWLYTAAHEALIETLSAWGVQAVLCQPSAVADRDAEPFLCFERRARGDVLVGAAKICGSAQRRRRGALLQHGSLILSRSAAAPEIPGLDELSGHQLDPSELVAHWSQSIGHRLNLQFDRAPLEPGLAQRAAVLASEKYGGDRWTQRR